MIEKFVTTFETCGFPLSNLWFSFVAEPDFDDREDGGDAEAATAGRVRLDDPEGDPRTHHHHEERSVNLKLSRTMFENCIFCA